MKTHWLRYSPPQMEEESIQTLLKEGSKRVRVHFFSPDGDPRGKAFLEFAHTLVLQGLDLNTAGFQENIINTLPFLAFSGDEPPRHYYQTIPTGLEWNPFYSLIKTLSTGKVSLPPHSFRTLATLKNPLTVRVLITPACPFCAQMVTLANQIAAANPLITAWIIDLELFPEWFRQYRPKAAPATILGEEVFLTGLVPEAELVGWLEKLESRNYPEELYRHDLLEKRLGAAVERIKNHPQDLPILTSLLKAEEFGIKLGAMAIIEQLSEEDPRLQGIILEGLIPLLRDTSDQLVGDVAYLIGLLQDQRKIGVLEKLLLHPNPEVVEVAQEGLAAG